MENAAARAIAIVGVGAVLPDAPDATTFWENIKSGRDSITEVTPDRWDPKLYYDPDPSASDKTYSKIGGWVREQVWDPMKWHMPIPPRVAHAMDDAQKWAIASTRQALEDYGYPKRPVDLERTAVILGNAMGGEKQYLTVARAFFPEYTHELAETPVFSALPEAMRRDIIREFHQRIQRHLPEITEDTMPGELANCIAGRIANLFNFHGPNYVVDAACASAMAAVSASANGLAENEFDLAITGGIDHNMGASTFVKFCKIGALSATGTRPYAEGADGFVMGEGAAIFLLKRLADAERDGDVVYAVLRGIGGSSDGKGKGITAPNPIGQKIAIQRAWENAGLSPATATFIEGHGTSTRVGDVVEVESLLEVFGSFHLPPHSVALGSVKSNIGHLKAAAGAAGLLKAALAVRDNLLPPSLHCEHPNPDIPFTQSAFFVNTKLRPWTLPADGVRRAGVSAFGFGGTNFHLVLEEHIPGKSGGNGKRSITVGDVPSTAAEVITMAQEQNRGLQARSSRRDAAGCVSAKSPLRGALVVGAASDAALAERLCAVQKAAEAGRAPARSAPAEADLRAPERVAIDYVDATDLASKSTFALKALAANQPALWKALRAQGIFRGHGPTPKVAFLYPGQGSQYVNMLKPLRETEPIVGETFAEADRVMTPLLGKPLSDYIFVDQADEKATAQAEDALKQTAITQPAVLASDLALTRLLAAYGIRPDLTMGHSLGEYGALVAAGALPFADALEAVSARGREMTHVAVADKGRMAAVFAPLAEIERILKTAPGYVVIANINSEHQAVIGGASETIEHLLQVFQNAGYEIVELPVSHAFHTSIVAPASEPLRRVLARLHLESPHLPIVANVDGEFYPTGAEVVPQMLDILARQIASPVQFIKGLRTLYNAGVRVFIEVGPKKALQGFAEDVLGSDPDVVSLFTNHPKVGDIASFNQALCGLYAAGLGLGHAEVVPEIVTKPAASFPTLPLPEAPAASTTTAPKNGDRYAALGHLFADVLERGWKIYHGQNGADEPVAITGAALGLPGADHIFDDASIGRILRGEQFISAVPAQLRQAMLDKHITRLVKSDSGEAVFETIRDVADVIKLAGRGGVFDLENEFGVPAERLPALDRVTRLAIAAGIDALRDAGIPLAMRYKTTTKGTQLPDRWALPDALRDDTGVIFASAFPGYDSLVDEVSRYYVDQSRREQLSLLENLRARIAGMNGNSALGKEIDSRLEKLRIALARETYTFDRRFLFKTLSMGHSQFAEYIGARGPNTAVNAACASTTLALALAEDWIRNGRCRRVVIISADDVTSDHLLEWMGAGFLASGAAATDEKVEEAAIPFDRRRHGMLIGMGAAALVVESADAVRERGIRPICEVLSTVTANSAFHGTRLDVQHICQVMEDVVARTERRSGISRQQIAPQTVFVSHETYTPARGGSASAEIHALRRVFGGAADQIVIANTKGFTGHAMGTGIEDVVAVKALETGCVPPVANFKEIDPELGSLNLSKGGNYPVDYALRLAAGFGSQISMALLRWVAPKDRARCAADALGYAYRIADAATWQAWLNRIAQYPSADLEVVRRTLRVRDQGVPARVAEAAKQAIVTATVPQPTPVVEKTPTRPAAVAFAKSAAQVVASAATEELETTGTNGYPIDVFDLDVDAEGDVDGATIMQAEALATLHEVYEAEREAPLGRDLASYVSSTAVEQQGATLEIPPTVTKKEPTPAAAGPVAVPATPGDSVQERILALVVEKTGYPKDMLDLDLDLEADLGIDTVKQAEMFAAIREIYNIPRDESRKLRDFPTLAHVIRFVYDKRPDLAGAASAPVEAPAPVIETVIPSAAVAPTPAPPPATATTPSDDSIKEKVLEIVAEKTGYPKDMLDLDLDLEADLGIDTVKQAEMFAAIRAAYNIPRDQNLKLRDFPTLAHVIRFARERLPGASLTVAVTSAVSHPEAAPAIAPVAPSATVEMRAPVPVCAGVAAPTDDSIKDKVLEIVAEKTGYPKDMLDLDLDLEADLGIDTVKQAEMFAAIRAVYNIPRDQNLKLRDFPTLAHVIRFARERLPRATATPPITTVAIQREPAPASTSVPAIIPRPVLASLDAANRIPRRVPVPVLRPALTLCKPTGVTLAPRHRVVIMPDYDGVAEALAHRLQSMGVETFRTDGAPHADQLTDRLKSWLAAGSIDGVYWLPALTREPLISDMDVNTWHEALRVRIKLLFATMRDLYEQVAPAGTFLVSATRLGGQHGYDGAGAVAPLGGAVTGFAKAYKRERPDALVKAVDFEAQREPQEIADILIAETLRDPGAVEIGYKAEQRWAVGLEEQPAADGTPGMVLDKNTVFLITGAAGGIVSAITADLAAASSGTFYLLDVVPEPDPANPDLKRFSSDKDGLKRDLFARIQARGERATPALIEKELTALERAQAAQSAIDSVRAAGGTAHYFSVNLIDAEAVAGVIREVRERSGRIDVLLHAAGMERSHFLPDKEPREFDLVFDVKADGFFNLLHAVGDMALAATVVFSSVAGRFGNGGQTDYSAANDLLCKITSSLRTTRPNTRAIAIDWTAWGGIGMATRGSIPKMMEVAGIDMLPPEAGIPLIRRELTAGGTRGEIVIAQRLGIMINEYDPSGGLDLKAIEASPQELSWGPMIGKIAGFGLHSGLTVETTLDPKVQPFLRDHQIDGTPVLPGVMGIEAFAEAALWMLPGWHVESVEDVTFLAPFKFYRNEPRAVTVEAALHPAGNEVLADCRLIGRRLLHNQTEPQVTTHFTGRVRLLRQVLAALPGRAPAAPSGSVFEAADIYRIYFHGPTYRVLERAWWDGNRVVGLMAKGLPANHHPCERLAVLSPRLIELCLQTAGLWEINVQGGMGLPQHIAEVCLWGTPDQAVGRLYAIVTADPAKQSFEGEVLDEAGNRYVRVSGYRTEALPNKVDAASLKKLQAVA